MKKLFSTIAVVALSALSLNAQIKEGIIQYEVELDGLPAEMAAKMGENKTIVSFKNDKALSENSSNTHTIITISDSKQVVTLMTQFGKKMGVVKTLEELKEENKNILEPKIEYINETKIISGYECKKAIITTFDMNKNKTVQEIWYCDKFINSNFYIKGLKGVVFEYTNQGPGYSIKTVAKKISIEPVSDEIFIPSTNGYNMMSVKKWNSNFGVNK